jgi:cytochrome c556
LRDIENFGVARSFAAADEQTSIGTRRKIEMRQSLTGLRAIAATGEALALSAGIILSANAQSAAPAPAPAPAARAGGAGPSPSKAAIETRKAAYTLIGNYFRQLGAVAKGTAPYDEAEATKRATRIAFLSNLPGEAFPDVSNVGEPDTKAKADVWTNRADFDKRLKDFQAHAVALVQVNATEKGATDGFKAAVVALGEDCKGCHDTYKVK